MRTILNTLVGVLLLLFITIEIVNVAQTEPVHIDETDWILDTHFYEKTFLNKSPSDPMIWTTVQALSHASLTKYIYGAYLYSTQPHFSSAREQLHNNFGEKFGGGQEDVTPFAPYVMKLRHLTTIITLSTLVLLFIFMNTLTQSRIAGIILVILLSQNKLFLYTMTRATWDCVYIFFLTVAFVSYSHHLKTQKISYLVFAAIAAGATIISKLTGAIFHVGFTIFSTLSLFLLPNKKHETVMHWFFVMLVTTAIWVNFSIYFLRIAPTSSHELIKLQMIINERLYQKRPEAFKTYLHRLQVLYCLTMQPSCLQPTDRQYLYRASATHIPVINIAIFLVGIFFCVSKMQPSKKRARLYVLVMGLTSIITMFFLINVPWDRYYLPAIYFIAIFQALGLWSIIALAKEHYVKRTYESFITNLKNIL